jgi:hypothetical protein
VLNKQFGRIKGAVSDLHHDVTTRRGGGGGGHLLTGYDRVESIVADCQTIKAELDRTDGLMDRHALEFQLRWEAELLRMRREQQAFREQEQQLANLKAELRQLLLITQQLEPYIRSMSALRRGGGGGRGAGGSRTEQPERDSGLHFLPPQQQEANKQRCGIFALHYYPFTVFFFSNSTKLKKIKLFPHKIEKNCLLQNLNLTHENAV